MRLDTVVAYTYKADICCPSCIQIVMPTGAGEEFDGWAVSNEISMDTEEFLDGIAQAFTINRENENSFDSDEFPKVIFRDMVDGDETCGECGEEL